MLETILAVAGLVVLLALLVVMFCVVAHMCFGNGGSLWNYILFGREGMELCLKGICWCIYAICMVIADSNRS